MNNNKTLIWLAPGGAIPDSCGELARHWALYPADLSVPARRRTTALPKVRVGVIDLTGFKPDQQPHLESWIEALSPTQWVGLLAEQPAADSPLSEMVAAHCTDYHTLPYDMLRLDNTLGHLWGMAELLNQLQGRVRQPFQLHALAGRSPAIQQTRALLRRLAQTAEPVLITGESGTGKNAACRFIHEHSAVQQGPFVTVNCAALPVNLTQSELFGYEKGAFTHALTARAGRIEQADGGTLILRDIDELQLEQQSALLRFLQEGLVERLGCQRQRRVHARVIATSSQPLEPLVAQERFRADIFYRLGNLQIALPPLRERLEDLPELAGSILRAAARHGRHHRRRLSEAAMASLLAHPWPGNLRELQNRLQRAILLSESDTITPADLGLDSGAPEASAPAQLSLARFRARAEREAITHCLNLANNNISAAARMLQISRLSLYRLMAKHDTGPAPSAHGRPPAARKGGLS
ncbi:sigma-54-dependent Fis family transcriptional regulator [Marinobacter halodurans]|uniref:Sigma-54-dependent Fis family transcriptional regulator n=1 Tax=Marinobacter halodurans TaxID=2528979 RepID=A0ABY1ZP84_9GAMM|nr:sigma-54 dependent transcriptional regulator [Marinobacter halodurans]TBW58514.1 sigma-54-dependent Fis family transcriptional regulator [Marinobacter halodurans]